jgi:hypothetical protein
MNPQITEFLLKNVNETEKTFSDITKALKIYVEKQEKVRLQTLKLIKAFKYCSTQVPSSSKQYIEALSNSLTLIEYYIKILDDRIDQRICKTLDFFANNNCKLIKNYIHERKEESKNDLKNHSSLNKAVIKDPSNSQKLASLQENINLRLNGTFKTNEDIINNIKTFNKEKLKLLKRTMDEFLYGEIIYHAKALESLSFAHQILNNSNIKKDVEVSFIYIELNF